MSTPHHLGIIGLGVMGQRTLARLETHPELRPVIAWDPNRDACALMQARYPRLLIAASAEALFATPGLHCLYIATPPGQHLELSGRAFDAGLAVVCEKPLSTDLEGAQALVRRIEAEGLRAGVNFVLAGSPGLALLQRHFGAAARAPLGALRDVEVELAFISWPRPWQTAAGPWLARRTEGGFTREVLSHFIFVLQRVLGPAKLVARRIVYPDDGMSAETLLRAELRCGDVPVRISGRVAPDVEAGAVEHNRMVWRASGGEIEARSWLRDVELRHDGQAPQRIDTSAEDIMLDQQQQWVAMIDGKSHSLPDFAEALAVQRTIESLLDH